MDASKLTFNPENNAMAELAEARSLVQQDRGHKPISNEQQQPLSDPEIIQILRSKAPDDFEQLFNEYRRKVYSLALRMLGNPEEAEEVVQEVFIQLFRKGDSFQGDSAFGTWLHRLTVNSVLMRMRRNKRHRIEQPADDGELETAIVKQSSQQQGLNLLDRMHLIGAIRKLPKGYRQVLLLHDIDGYEHNEIASMMGISAGTTKSQLHKARAKLRKLLTARLKSGRTWIPHARLILDSGGRS